MSGSKLNCELIDLMQREHEQLLQALTDARHALASNDRDRVHGLMAKLSELVETHFRHEEEGGYLSEVLERAPRLGPQAEVLRSQHETLQEDIEKIRLLVHSGVESDSWWQRIESDFNRFTAQLMRHEHEETELVQEAFTQDVGTGD